MEIHNAMLLEENVKISTRSTIKEKRKQLITLVNELDGAKVIKQTKNDATQKLSVMFFEEKKGVTIEVAITALAIAQYEDEAENGYYIFMCDSEWTIQDDHKVETVEEAIAWTEKNFDITEEDWL